MTTELNNLLHTI